MKKTKYTKHIQHHQSFKIELPRQIGKSGDFKIPSSQKLSWRCWKFRQLNSGAVFSTLDIGKLLKCNQERKHLEVFNGEISIVLLLMWGNTIRSDTQKQIYGHHILQMTVSYGTSSFLAELSLIPEELFNILMSKGQLIHISPNPLQCVYVECFPPRRGQILKNVQI